MGSRSIARSFGAKLPFLLLTAVAALAASPANAVEIEYVTVRHAGNPCDPQPTGSCFGAVDYDFEISRYEITNAQYVEFLNAVANETDVAGLYNPAMAGIEFPLLPVGFERFYEVVPGYANKPVDHVSVYDAFRFANWLHHGKPSGVTGIAAIEGGAYTLEIMRQAMLRNPGAEVFIPSRDEWYKAAYYDPGSGYFEYPNGADASIVCATPLAASGGANCESAVGGVTDVGAYVDSMSPFGTLDQGGNVSEWTETIVGVGTREVRGGNWFSSASSLGAATSNGVDVDSESIGFGFRVARLAPEAGAGAFAAVSALALLVVARAPSKGRGSIDDV